ncbi:MAG: hypothetical protein IT375_21705 [Polyangiaceae bacterium]|nr:hypothetical protein [Polyangiaceae bacterium]
MLFDVLALVFGIWLTVRKLDVRRREAADHPGVEPAEFERWKAMALGAYNLGSLGCFAKLALDYLLQLGGPRVGVPWPVIRVGGAGLFVAWVVLLVTVWVQAHRAKKLQEKLGLQLLPKPAPEAEKG